MRESEIEVPAARDPPLAVKKLVYHSADNNLKYACSKSSVLVEVPPRPTSLKNRVETTWRSVAGLLMKAGLADLRLPAAPLLF